MIVGLAILALVLSLLPAALFWANLPLFQCSPKVPSDERNDQSSVSVLIPARDEEAGIEACVRSALASTGVDVRVIVMDDASTDRTAEIVTAITQQDSRVRLIQGQGLPPGWNGKQHACLRLAEHASTDHFVFLDADVRLRQDALERLLHYRHQNHVDLLSAFPQQITGTWLERWLIPMMHFILLGYLPFARMRSDNSPSLAAGCGQLFLTSRDAYKAAGTHEAIKDSRHDGVKLPRAYRAAGLTTDVIDGSDMATCRMYHNAREVIRGVLKNATEGIANPRVIAIFTVFLLGCSLLPVVALLMAIAATNPIAATLSIAALAIAHTPRLIAAHRLHQSWFGAICHIPATTFFIILQWIALAMHIAGRQVRWRGRG